MKTTERFDNAVSKLYTAFWNGTLNAMDCKACACGNICNNSRDWVKDYKSDSGYSPDELLNIEQIFMHGYREDIRGYINHPLSIDLKYLNRDGIGWDAKKVNSENKDLVFLAMTSVVEYLCELDDIPNVMDYTKLFESENNEPKYQLTNQLN